MGLPIFIFLPDGISPSCHKKPPSPDYSVGKFFQSKPKTELCLDRQSIYGEFM